MAGIDKVKAGDILGGSLLLEEALKKTLDNGAEGVILGCTEIPLALERIHSTYLAYTIDATKALSKACVNWYHRKEPVRQAAGNPFFK